MNLMAYTSANHTLTPVFPTIRWKAQPTSLEMVPENQEIEDGYAFVISGIHCVEKRMSPLIGKKYRVITRL